MQNRRRGGKLLQCLQVTDNIAIGVSTLDELETYGLKRPTQIEDAKKKDLGSDAILAAAHHVREAVQRRFDAARRKRAAAYGTYLAGLITGGVNGGVPPITLYCPTSGTPTEGGLLLPHSSPLVTLDGETQTEARFALRESEPDSGEVSVMFVLYHGINEHHAGNIMHDFNVFAHPVAETKVSALNHNGALTSIVVDAIQELGIHTDRIQRHSPTPNKNQMASYQCLVAGVAGAVLGRTLTGSLNANVQRLNTQPNGINRDAVKPFIVHALKLALSNPAIGNSKPSIWALAGGLYHDLGKLLTDSEWQTMEAAFNATKPLKGASNAAAVKRHAAFQAIGVTQLQGNA